LSCLVYTKIGRFYRSSVIGLRETVTEQPDNTFKCHIRLTTIFSGNFT